jgi:hypothetical protein
MPSSTNRPEYASESLQEIGENNNNELVNGLVKHKLECFHHSTKPLQVNDRSDRARISNQSDRLAHTLENFVASTSQPSAEFCDSEIMDSRNLHDSDFAWKNLAIVNYSIAFLALSLTQDEDSINEQQPQTGGDDAALTLEPSDGAGVLEGVGDRRLLEATARQSSGEGAAIRAQLRQANDRLTPQMESVLAEFRQSAIPDAATLAKVRWIEGDIAIEMLGETAIAKCQNVTSYMTEPAKRIMAKLEFARAGGWLACDRTIDGGMGKVPYFKPVNPRMDFEGRKKVKYEIPRGMEGTPLIPPVLWGEGLEIARKNNLEKVYRERFAQEFSDRPCPESLTQELNEIDQGFWLWWHSVNGAIALTEGWKKALSLIAHGQAAIACRSITTWNKKGTQELHDAIAQFATRGREFSIFFDEDEKPKTRTDVHRQQMKLAAALELAGAKVKLPSWDGKALGKGIDDVLFRLGDSAEDWLDGLLKSALTPKQVKRGDRKNQAANIIKQLNQLGLTVERATEGDYLPKLPELQPGAIHVLAASMNAGKTTRFAEDLVPEVRARGGLSMLMTPINSVGEQAAGTCEYPHIHDYGNSREQQDLLWADVRNSGGLALCPDSLHRVPQWFFDDLMLVILDEANQVIKHTAQGNTTKSRYSQILELLKMTLRTVIENGGAIVLAEDGIPDRAVNFTKAFSGAQTVRVFTHLKEAEPWDCTVYQGQASGFRGMFLQAAGSKKLLYVSTSQQEAKRVERALLKCHPGLKVIRIDSETNQGGKFSRFFRKPDEWLKTEQPDILILSPSAKSGVSIEGEVSFEDAYFNQVWGYFPALATDSHMQLLGRNRPSVPRVVFCPEFIQSNSDEALLYPSAIARQLKRKSRLVAGVYQLEELLQAEGDRAEEMATIESAVHEYLCAEIAVAGAQKLMAHDALVDRLEAAGHRVKSKKLSGDPAAVELWKQVTEELWQEDAAKTAAAIVTDKHTPEWAANTLESQDSTLENRVLAHKVLLREEFPGVLFDDPKQCYEALFKDYGTMKRGVTLQFKAENLEAARAIDKSKAEEILSQPIRALHRLPKDAIRGALLARIGILALLDGSRYSNQDERVKSIKAIALRYKTEIADWLNLHVKESQSGVEITNKLIKRFGLKAVSVARPGSSREGAEVKQGDRHYQVIGWDDPVRVQLLEAMRRKLSESESTISNKQNNLIEIMDSPPETPQNQGDWAAAESLAELGEFILMLEADPDDLDLRKLVESAPLEARRRAIALQKLAS